MSIPPAQHLCTPQNTRESGGRSYARMRPRGTAPETEASHRVAAEHSRPSITPPNVAAYPARTRTFGRQNIRVRRLRQLGAGLVPPWQDRVCQHRSGVLAHPWVSARTRSSGYLEGQCEAVELINLPSSSSPTASPTISTPSTVRPLAIPLLHLARLALPGTAPVPTQRGLDHASGKYNPHFRACCSPGLIARPTSSERRTLNSATDLFKSLGAV